jgi:hypothetical protein
MARASTRTLLPLDRWAAILGIEPRHFNSVTRSTEEQQNCDQSWFQYGWQMADRVGREDVAMAIAQAEADVIEALGFFPLPDWTDGEIVRTRKPGDPLLNGMSLYTARGLFPGVGLKQGMILMGGVRESTLIATALRHAPAQAGDTLTLLDLDGDGYDETARIVLPTTVTDTNEIRCYFHDHSAEDEWEIRPLRSVTIAAGSVTILIDRHLLVNPNLWEALDVAAVDADTDSNFVTEIDVYQVANDPSDQCTLQWEAEPGGCACSTATCEACTWRTQAGCLQIRDPRLGEVTYRPAEWTAATSQYGITELAVCRMPDRVSVNYLAGYQSARVKRPWVEMDPTLERIITYYSVTLLDRPICNCNNIESYINRWREDRALIGESGSYKINTDLDCPWGTREGAIWAWKQVQRYRIGKAVEY